MIALSENLIRSVKVGSSALEFDEFDDEAALSSEQSRSHAVIESMLASSPPQPATTILQSSTTFNREIRNESQTTPNIISLPSPNVLELNSKSPPSDIHSAPETGEINENTKIHNQNSDESKSKDESILAAQQQNQNHLNNGIAKNTTNNNTNNNLLPAAPRRSIHPRSQSANQFVTATATGSSTSANNKHSSTLSDDAFSKEAVVVTPVHGKSSLSRELSDNGIMRLNGSTRPYSSSANSSPRHGSDPRNLGHTRDRSDLTFTSTGTIVPNINNAHHRTRSRARSSTVTSLKIFPGVDRSPISLVTPMPCTVIRVIEMAMIQFREENIQPPLKFDTSDAYELRVLDDDDGTPDDDMPPLDRDRDIHEYGVDAVAFVEIPDYQPNNTNPIQTSSSQQQLSLKASNIQQQRDRSMQPPQLTRVGSLGSMNGITGSRWDDLNSPRSGISSPQSSMPVTPQSNTRTTSGPFKLTVKVILADMETHLLTLSSDNKLEDLLPLISRRKSSQLQPEHWKFIYHNENNLLNSSHSIYQLEEIDPKTILSQLNKLELRLLNKLDTPRRLLPETNNLFNESEYQTAPHPDQFILTLDSASAYSEYRVIKTNERGKKQNRMFGIDRHKVYNKHVANAAMKRRISFQVTRAYRTIRSISSINTDSATKFSIIYFEKGGKLSERQYETETKMECAEIVAKLRFLVNLARTTNLEQKDELKQQN